MSLAIWLPVGTSCAFPLCALGFCSLRGRFLSLTSFTRSIELCRKMCPLWTLRTRSTSSLYVGFLLSIILGLCSVAPTPASASNGYSYSRPITIDHTKVPHTDQANFPVLISGTYPYLASTSNGGNVTSANGYDILFTADAGGTTPLAFEQESYSPSTGAVTYWVKVPTLSHTSDTVIYLFYGNASVSSDPSNKTGVWDSNYQGVWHLEDNAANHTVQDSTSNGSNGTSAANSSSKSTTGEIGE